MNTINYLKETYGYGVPILLKNIHIGGKSKTSIRKDLSRGVENGLIIRKGQGVYCFKEDEAYLDGVTFESVIEKKYLKDDYGLPGLNLDVYGYVTGLSFLNQLGISQQVPAVLEVVTNNTSCKRIIKIKNRVAIIRKGKIKIDRFNYRILQFFDIFYTLDKDEVKDNRDILEKYIHDNFSKVDFERYISLYPLKTIKIIVESGIINAFR